MTNQHPITPPPELVQQWYNASSHANEKALQDVATAAAQWGADQELEACCLLLDNGEHAASYGCHDGSSLRAARRPKPPSLKEQALTALTRYTTGEIILTNDSVETIRRALEQLDG